MNISSTHDLSCRDPKCHLTRSWYTYWHSWNPGSSCPLCDRVHCHPSCGEMLRWARVATIQVLELDPTKLTTEQKDAASETMRRGLGAAAQYGYTSSWDEHVWGVSILLGPAAQT